MGLVYADLILKNAKFDMPNKVRARALVDTGSLFLCIPESVCEDLGITEFFKKQVRLADGSYRESKYVGPIEVNYEDKGCIVGALVMGDEVLLGAIPMEDMDIMVDPSEQRLITANQARV